MTRIVIIISVINIFICASLSAQQIPAGQDAGSTIKSYIDEKKQDEVLKRIREPRPPSLHEPEIEALPYKRTSVYISRIIIQQDRGINEEELLGLTKGYEKKPLSLKEMKALASAITSLVTRHKLKAYIPNQPFTNGVMYINLVSEEGP
jgi:hemolysin activation/secretion protein